MAEKKLTQKELYTEAIKVFEEANRPDLVKFAEERIEVLDKKTANRKPTKAQEETVALRDAIVAFLTEAEAPQTVLRSAKDGSVVREIEKADISRLVEPPLTGALFHRCAEDVAKGGVGQHIDLLLAGV